MSIYKNYVHLLQASVDEYRRDRAKAQLRGNYLISMALFLTVFVAGFTPCFILAVSQAALHQPVDLLFVLLLMLFAGTAGSILSRAIKLGRQLLHAEPGAKQDEVPLGIRALMADRKTSWLNLAATTLVKVACSMDEAMRYPCRRLTIRGIFPPPWRGGNKQDFVQSAPLLMEGYPCLMKNNHDQAKKLKKRLR